MPVILDTQNSMRAARLLRFCYLCGRNFNPAEKVNSDHVPPTGLFAIADRNFPLILPTHQKCNAMRSADDQVVGQLVGVIHGRKPNPTHKKFRVSVGRFKDGSPAIAVRGLDLDHIIWRWVRGFHAALYNEYLPEDTRFLICPPLPEAELSASGPQFLPVAEAIPKFVEELKRNRATCTLDRIVCRNGKCRYECIWDQAEDGTWICIYALDLYQWIDLGHTSSSEPRGCIGSYIRSGGNVPMGATCATRLEFPISNHARLDPFGA